MRRVNRTRLAAALFLVLVLLGAVLRSRLHPTQPLATTSYPVTVLLVQKLSLEELQRLPGILPTDPVAVLPTRGGPGSWSLRETILTGSRSPLPPTAPRLTGFIEVAGAAQIAPWLQKGGRVLIVSLSDGAARFVPLCLQGSGQAGLLTSPSTGFRPGLVAATDLAQTVATLRGQTGMKFGAGRPLVVGPGSSAQLPGIVTALGTQAKALRFLVFVPWALSALLLLAAGRRWPALTLLCTAFALCLLFAPLVVSGEIGRAHV